MRDFALTAADHIRLSDQIWHIQVGAYAAYALACRGIRKQYIAPLKQIWNPRRGAISSLQLSLEQMTPGTVQRPALDEAARQHFGDIPRHEGRLRRLTLPEYLRIAHALKFTADHLEQSLTGFPPVLPPRLHRTFAPLLALPLRLHLLVTQCEIDLKYETPPVANPREIDLDTVYTDVGEHLCAIQNMPVVGSWYRSPSTRRELARNPALLCKPDVWHYCPLPLPAAR